MLEDIKMLLGIADDSQDALITYHINVISRKILNYCNIIELPQELEFVVVEKVVGIIQNGTGGTLIEGSGAVKAVTRGDTKIEYDVGTKQVGGYTTSSNILDNVKTQLNRFRRVKFK